jgi:hypothetical protein
MNKSHKFKEPVKITSNKIVITVQNIDEINKIKKILEGDKDA